MLTDPFGFTDPRNPRALTPPAGYEDVHLPGMTWPIAGDRKETTSHISPAQWSQLLAQFRALLFIAGVDLSDLEDDSPYILREAMTRAITLLTLTPTGAWALDTDYAAKDIAENDGSAYVATAAHTAAAATEPGVGGDWATVWQLLVSKGDQGNIGSLWLSGSGVPSGALGGVGDFYLDNVSGDYYEKTGASAWTLRGNLVGPVGPGDMDTSVYDTNDDGKVDAADVADEAPWSGLTGIPATLLFSNVAAALSKGFPDTPQNAGSLSGPVTPAISNGHNQYGTFDGVTFFNPPSDFGKFSMDVTIGASQSGTTVDLSNWSGNVFGDDLTDISGDKFTLWCHRGQYRSSLVIEADAGNA